MAASPYAAKLAAYSAASTHGGVAAADPHKLILMLLDGALERISTARGCIERSEFEEKAQLLHRTVSILGELQASLDQKVGGAVAENLAQLYDYMSRRLLLGNVRNDVKALDEVSKLLHTVRDAWAGIPAEVRRK